MTKAQEKIKDVIREVQDLLIRKNEQYGNSALEPTGIFDSIESDEDIVKDLIGYLILLLISMRGY